MTVRVRFSPAPTGSLHIGSIRTALFNWVFARHHSGVFILRIEDTDVERSREEWITGIQETLLWLGLRWDEGPYLQSQHTQEYLDAAKQLVDNGSAYECFCTEEEVKAYNDAQMTAGKTPGYSGKCRSLTEEQRAAFRAEGRTPSIRFRTPDSGTSEFEDVIRGHVAVEWENIPDFVIVRNNGQPLFFLANAVDDVSNGITHVIRGEDLLDTTHRVIALRRALGHEEQPVYAHLPLLLGGDRGKLSKRHGSVAMDEFKSSGYLPDAINNYLMLLGWSPPDGEELFTMEKAAKEFDLDRVTHSAAFFDHQKLDYFNGEYIRRMSLAELVDAARPFALERFDSIDEERFAEACRIGQERAITLTQLVEQMDFLFAAEFTIAPESWEKVVATERVGEIFDAVTAYLENTEWTPEGVDLRPVLSELGLKPKKVMPALYSVIEGRHAGLPLFDALVLVGRESALERLRSARAKLDT